MRCGLSAPVSGAVCGPYAPAVITENPDVSREALRDVVERGWDVDVTELEFLTVGGDSWSYRVGALFINVREALGQRKPWSFPQDVEQPLRAAIALKERCALDFLLTPTPTVAGEPLVRLGRFAVTLFPYLDGHPSHSDTEEVFCDAETMSWIERLHAATPAIADVELASEDFRPDFAGTLRDVFSRTSIDGPYGEPVERLLADSRDVVLDVLERHEAHGDELRTARTPFVVTHGEPAGNVHIGSDGRRYLVDLVCLKRGPRERDLRDFPADARDASADRNIVLYYQRDFALSEVAEYGDRLTRPHVGDPEDDRAWYYLGEYVAEVASLG